MIAIGKASHKTHRPKDLDDRLIAATGCNAAEVAGMLGGQPSARFVATALTPFLGDDAPSLPDLTDAIAGDGGAQAAVRKLYASEPVVEEGGE